MCWYQTASVFSLDLQKLISTRAALCKVVKGQLNTITEGLCFEDINASLERPLEKIALLKQLNETNILQTDIADIECEIIESEEYNIDMESKIRKKDGN